MRLRGLAMPWLKIDDWEIGRDQTWCVLGGNASGKSALAAVLVGERDAPGASLQDPPANPIWVSFESAQDLYERELAEDDTDYLDRMDHGTTGLELLLRAGCSERGAAQAAARFGLAHQLPLGCRLFSSGEWRRFQILKAVLSKPDLLILDEPFEALDAGSRAALSELMGRLPSEGIRTLLMVNRLEDVAEWTTHLAVLRAGALVATGTRQELLDSPVCQQLFHLDKRRAPDPPPPPAEAAAPPDPLVALRRVSVRYGEIYQFRDFDWELRPGEHTLIAGPNGSGKSTLLNLLVGDHPQCYSNDISIVGYRRGSGESIWDIKRNIGLVSPALHRDYRVGGTVETVALSGFFDSIGLYQQPSVRQRQAARAWLDALGLGSLLDAPFAQLSYGQQRLALIARALVKQPPLLILDEPTQGLDDLNRHLVLACLERLTELRATTALFVTHREDERLALFERWLQFQPSDQPNVRYRIEQANRPR